MVDEFVDAATARSDYPPVVFVYQGTADQGPVFFDRFDPNAVAIADPAGDLYAEFGIPRAGLRASLRPDVGVACARTLAQGYFFGRKIGDPWTLPTVLAVRDRTIVAEHVGEHVADHPDIPAIPDALGRLSP